MLKESLHFTHTSAGAAYAQEFLRKDVQCPFCGDASKESVGHHSCYYTSAAERCSNYKGRKVVKPDKWMQRYVELAKHVALWSKDPSTKVGAVLVGMNRREIAFGYNGFPAGVRDTEDRLNDRKTKYALIAHAERNVLDQATFRTQGSTLYVTRHPCAECAKSIISKGVDRVVCPPYENDLRRAPPDSWLHTIPWARTILEEGGTKTEFCSFDGSIMQWHKENGGHGEKGPAGHALRLLREAVELCFASGAYWEQIKGTVNGEVEKERDRRPEVAYNFGVATEAEARKPVNISSGGDDVMEELADVCILAEVLANYAGGDLKQAIERKMEINRQRKWEPDLAGVLWRPRGD